MRRPRTSLIGLLGLAATIFNPLVSPALAQSSMAPGNVNSAALLPNPQTGKLESTGPLGLAAFALTMKARARQRRASTVTFSAGG